MLKWKKRYSVAVDNLNFNTDIMTDASWGLGCLYDLNYCKVSKKNKHWYSGQAHPQRTSLAPGGWLAHLQVIENGLSEMQ